MNANIEEKIKTYGVIRMARELGISHQAVYKWRHTGVPPSRVIHVAKRINVPPWEIRPDMF